MCIVVSVEEAFLERNYIQNTQHLHIWVGGEMGGLKFTTFGLPDIAENGSFLHCTSATKLWHPSVFALLLTYSSGKECWKELAAAAAVFLAEKDKEKMLRNFSNVTEKKSRFTPSRRRLVKLTWSYVENINVGKKGRSLDTGKHQKCTDKMASRHSTGNTMGNF